MLVIAFFKVVILLTNYYICLYRNLILKRFRLDPLSLAKLLAYLEVKVNV